MCGDKVPRQTVPDASSSDVKGSVADGIDSRVRRTISDDDVVDLIEVGSSMKFIGKVW